jgi:hypothetical protein
MGKRLYIDEFLEGDELKMGKESGKDQWAELRVKVPDGNRYKDNPELMKRVDEHLNMLCAIFKAPKGIPLQEEDGTWEVRVLDGRRVEIVKGILIKHYGFEVVSEVLYDH